MFADIIEILLKKKETLREEIEREFALRSEKIDGLLALAGYEPPVEEAVEPTEEAELVEAEIETDEAVPTPAVGMTVY